MLVSDHVSIGSRADVFSCEHVTIGSRQDVYIRKCACAESPDVVADVGADVFADFADFSGL